MKIRAKLFFVVCCVTFAALHASEPPKTHMTKERAISVAIRAIEQKYPGATKGWSFNAEFHHGLWGVAGVIPNRSPGLLGGGMPGAEIRDKNEKVINVYFAR